MDVADHRHQCKGHDVAHAHQSPQLCPFRLFEQLLDHELFELLAARFGLPELCEAVGDQSLLQVAPGMHRQGFAQAALLSQSRALGQPHAVFVEEGADAVAQPRAVLDGGAVGEKDFAQLTGGGIGLPDDLCQPA